MSDFMYFVISYLGRAMYLAVPAVLVCALFLFGISVALKKKGKTFPWGRAVLWLALLGWLLVVAVVTVVRFGGSGGWGFFNLHLFRAWKEAWTSFDQRSWLNILLNIAMFAPLGVLLPLMSGPFRRWYLTVGTGFFLSLAIEIIQLTTGRGLADVDDLFCNTLGCLAGYFLVMSGLWKKDRKKVLASALGLLAVILGISSPFLAYGLQELGNLPNAPAYQVRTAGVSWDIRFPLEEDAGAASLYRLASPTKATCEQTGRQVLDTLGSGEIDVWYYNDEVYLRSGDRCVSVYYLDGSYDYWEFQKEAAPAVLPPEVLREKLKRVGIELPEQAELTTEADDWYCFTVPGVQNGGELVDGTLRFRLTGEGTFSELENHLLSFAYVREVAIISPRAAVEKVMAGWITAPDRFERKAPREMELRSCNLSWQVDTKGFYQPVYLVEAASLDTDYEEIVVIPAIRA